MTRIRPKGWQVGTERNVLWQTSSMLIKENLLMSVLIIQQ